MEIVPIFQFFKKCPRLQYDFKNSLDQGVKEKISGGGVGLIGTVRDFFFLH